MIKDKTASACNGATPTHSTPGGRELLFTSKIRKKMKNYHSGIRSHILYRRATMQWNSSDL
jgi:hypothetical protein